MWWYKLSCLILCGCFFFALPGCGYRWASSVPISLPKGISKLYLQKVKNPTTQSWLESNLRTVFREEFTTRGKTKWVPKSQAEGLVQVDIVRYSVTTLLENVQEETVKSEVKISLQVMIYSRKEHLLLWDSGTITARESFTGSDESPEKRKAQHRVIELAVEEVADKLSQTF